MSLRADRVNFTACLALFLVEVGKKQWSYGKVEVVIDEGTVHTPRRVQLSDGQIVKAEDAVHKKGSRHYDGLAVDILIYINDEYISNGDHPIWTNLDRIAKEINPKLSFGIEFRDANHLSWAEGS